MVGRSVPGSVALAAALVVEGVVPEPDGS